jgi:D-sedoheptulose 7-phosphate isomerase
MNNNFVSFFIKECIETAKKIDQLQIDNLVKTIEIVRSEKGRIFFLGVGGSASNASHAVNDFRKLANIECYAPTDNVSELTARINDDGWETTFASWLKISKLNQKDMIFVLSVGGGNIGNNVSVNIIKAVDYALSIGAKIGGILGRDGGYTFLKSKNCVLIPVKNKKNVTPITESFQAVVWHLIISHPLIQVNQTKW